MPGFVLAGVEEGFSRLARVRRLPFLGVATTPQVFILARSDALKGSPCVVVAGGGAGGRHFEDEAPLGAAADPSA